MMTTKLLRTKSIGNVQSEQAKKEP